ncbi:hypothetical protein [Tardiphaga sp. 813_E8_N1_3]|uniref:hypothetical protein n=1 Tax=Tardiphaga sp. 813_E8_N1_3 TaxID=3240760 RepID=UPI003F25D552
MFRKVTLGLIAAASLGAAALAPSAASAHGWHVGGWHGGWGGYGHHAFYGGPTFYVGGLTDGCLQRRVVETRRGPRVRTVNVCAF